VEVLRLLLQLARGAAVDAVDPRNGFTAFHTACGNNQPECAEALARAGCDVGIKESNGFTGRELAEGQGHASVVERLRAAHSAAHSAAKSAPEPAAVAGDHGLGKQLLEAAIQNDGVAVARLLAAGADPNASITGRMPSGEVLHETTALIMAVLHGQLEAVRLLLDAGADPNASMPARMPTGKVYPTTALIIAAGNDQIEVLRLLLDAGSDPDRADGDGATPLIFAAGNGQMEVARLLLDAGADPSHADGDGGTPLMGAAQNGQLELLRLLLARGAAVDAAGPDTGCTAFHIACYRNQAECAEALARAGCDVGLKERQGQMGQRIAEVLGSKDVVRRLRALARQPFVGVLVELAGLVGAAEHNGKRATVMSTRPSRGHHASVFLARARILSALCKSSKKRSS
jgi:ankyrin repeat protein